MNRLRRQTLAMTPLPSPRSLTIAIPSTDKALETVQKTRLAVKRIIYGADNRLLVVSGPCSIHDPRAALEYAHQLAAVQNRYAGTIQLIMRVYFEKPRTSVGWKGLINDPLMDGSCDIHTGLSSARKLLLSINELGIGTGMELLDPMISHYIGDLISWAAIGARTTESQIHREMASGLAMPVGFKNNTDGDLQAAVHGILTARTPHSFLSIDRYGRICIARTKGNKHCHLVLRGGKNGPNYDSISLQRSRDLLKEANAHSSIIIDCSHMNSGKRCRNQMAVWNDVVELKANGNRSIAGIMVESNLFNGRQDIPADKGELRYGVSVTDECLGWDETEQLLSCTHERLKRHSE